MNRKNTRSKPASYRLGMFCVWLAAVLTSILAVWSISDWFALPHDISAVVLVSVISAMTLVIFLLHYRRQEPPTPTD